MNEIFTEKSLGKFFEDQVEKYPNQEFIVFPESNKRYTYRQFNREVDNFAKGLLSIGITKGDKIGIWAKNIPEWIITMFATAKIGATIVTMNTAYQSHEVEYIIKQSDMSAIIMSDGFRDINYNKIIREINPNMKAIIHIGPEQYRGMYNTDEIIKMGFEYDDEEYQKVKDCVTQNDVINMQYTSGTTGFPKGVMLTSRNIVNNGYYIGENMKYTRDDIIIIPVPLFHCFGTVLGVMAAITHGSTIVMVEEYDPLVALSSIQKEKCTSVYGVPTMFIGMMNHPMFDMFDMGTVRTGIMAGSTCPVEVMKAAVDKMNMTEITSVYGLTEASPGITQTHADDTFYKKVNTVGKALPGIEVKIVDPATGEEVGVGEPGEIMCRGFNVMAGYYNMPEKTAETITPDGWLHTGDIATVDEDGYYSIVGRCKDMIIRGGENIYPREIEEYIFTHECVRDVQVAGIPDEKYGEIVGAFIIKKDGYEDITESDIREYCIGNIARYKVPKKVFFVDEYPLTASGKILKYKLGEMAIRK